MMSRITARGACIRRPRLERSAIASARRCVAPSMNALAGRGEYYSRAEAVGAYVGVAFDAVIGLH